MNSTQYARYVNQASAACEQVIDGFDQGAHKVIDAWRAGTGRLGAAAKDRWDSAFEASRAELSAETRRNAAHARKVIGGYYTRGTTLAASGAEVAVATVVEAARSAARRAADWQGARG